MKPEGMRAAGRLATRTLADTVSQVEQVHRAVAARAFAFTAPASLPARVVHDGIATGVYAVPRDGLSTSGRVDLEEHAGLGSAQCHLGR